MNGELAHRKDGADDRAIHVTAAIVREATTRVKRFPATGAIVESRRREARSPSSLGNRGCGSTHHSGQLLGRQAFERTQHDNLAKMAWHAPDRVFQRRGLAAVTRVRRLASLPDVERQRPTTEFLPESTPAFARLCWTIAGDRHDRSWHTV
jgi:hypothetical protein